MVALLEDVAEHDLQRGQVGTLVEQLGPGVYEVEFSDDQGRTYATLSLRADQLLQLHHQPGPASADCAALIGSMKGKINLAGDVFSTGIKWNAPRAG